MITREYVPDWHTENLTVDKGQLKELDKIEQNITVTYDLINKFEAFQKTQAAYNDQVINDLNKIYSLINELNSNTNRKFDMVLKNSNNKELSVLLYITQ